MGKSGNISFFKNQRLDFLCIGSYNKWFWIKSWQKFANLLLLCKAPGKKQLSKRCWKDSSWTPIQLGHLHGEIQILVFPVSYLELSNLLTLICLFIVITNRMIKYMTKIGQNTGILNASKNVHIIAMTTALVPEYLQKKNRKTNTTCVKVKKNKQMMLLKEQIHFQVRQLFKIAFASLLKSGLLEK